MNIIELLDEVGHTNIKLQLLNFSITRAAIRAKITNVTFTTNELSPADILCRDEAGKVGMILWMTWADYNRALHTVRERSLTTPAPASDELESLRAIERRFNGLRELCGHVEDGSSQPITISQDDATKDWCVTFGATFKRTAFDSSFTGAIDKALEMMK